MLRVRTNNQYRAAHALDAQSGEQPAQQAGLHKEPGQQILQHQRYIQPQRQQHLPHHCRVQQKQGQGAAVAIRHGEQACRCKPVQEQARLIGCLHLGREQLRQPFGNPCAERMCGRQRDQRKRGGIRADV